MGKVMTLDDVLCNVFVPAKFPNKQCIPLHFDSCHNI